MARSKRLIINADDLGVSRDINRGIVKCLKEGIATDTSVLACGIAFDHAVGLLKDNGIYKTGVHIALTEGFRPVSPLKKVETLIGGEGTFKYNFETFFGNLIIKRIGYDEIYREIKAQINKVKKTGLVIDHIDGHQHVHVFPSILKIVLRIMREEGIKAIRFPLEKVKGTDMLREPVNCVRSLCLKAVCRSAGKIMKNESLKHNDLFLGHFHSGDLTREEMLKFLDNMENGLNELGCHPGFIDEGVTVVRPWYRNAENELNVLCDPVIAEEIKKRDIELVSY